MEQRPLVLLTPSQAAAWELLRRLASSGRALAGIYPFKLKDLARALAEPALLGRGLSAWDAGHAALLAARFLDGPHGLTLPQDLPRAPLARALAETLVALRRAGVRPEALDTLAAEESRATDDRERLRALGGLLRRFLDSVVGHFADPATVYEAAGPQVAAAEWLVGASALIVDELILDASEQSFLAALAQTIPVRRLERHLPPGLRQGSFETWAESRGLAAVALEDTPLAPLATSTVTEGLRRLRETLFEPPGGSEVRDGSVELVTAPGEAAEAGALARRLLAEARRGVPFEEMGVLLPRPDVYAPIFTDLFRRVGIPCRLHPSLPLATGRSARSLLLLFRCRGLARPAVMEFLTFAPIPWKEIVGDEARAKPEQWDQLSRDAQIVSELPRWIVGLHAHAEAEREGAAREESDSRRRRRLDRAEEAEQLLEVVKLLSGTLDALAGEASWTEWSDRLIGVLDQWIGPGSDREAVAEVLADLGGLSSAADRTRWSEVEEVLEARFSWERMPLDPIETGAVHVGVLDALAGLPFRVVALAGLVEGGYPGVFRPDPFLLDPEREALSPPPVRTAPAATAPPSRGSRQLSLLTAMESAAPSRAAVGAAITALLPTTQDRLRDARRAFHGAISQATEKLILSYPRADSRSGRERLPSLFLVAAASALLGRPVGAADLERLVVEDDPVGGPLELTLDPSERDRKRVLESGEEAVRMIEAASPGFAQARRAARARWYGRFSEYDGFVGELPGELRAKLDPLSESSTTSASRLATFSRCGFMYLLQYVLHLEPALEPEERRRLDPLERGTLFHEVAELFLRERRDRDELPVRDTPEMQERLLVLGNEALDRFVAGSPPRFTLLWEREKRQFRSSLLQWLAREAVAAERSTPAHFEVGFGLPVDEGSTEPHSRDPLVIDLGDGRSLRVIGKIDRIDERPDGTLLLRDYKTGKAPRDDGGIFRGGKQLQIPFYVLAAERLFPGKRVTEAFLDYVDGGRQVAFNPARVTGEDFRKFLKEMLGVVGSGIFAQEPTSCDFCDFKAACGPKGLIERRRSKKTGDPNLKRALRLRDWL
jgi:ATP-dependent helicase/nuclease subunit B